MTQLKHNRSFDPCYGAPVEITPGVRRLTANNPSPFTFHGTNTYLVGIEEVAVIDPGPADTAHLDAILQAAGSGRISTILVTHTHKDHSPAAAVLKSRTGAQVLGCGPHISARPLAEGEANPLDASSDNDYRPDQQLRDGDIVSGKGWSFETAETPGHTANHLCFALASTEFLFSADHVMAWSTSIVAPPDGSMTDYMASLEKLLSRSESRFLPGHGGIVENAHDYLKGLKSHRLAREASILAELTNASRSIPELVEAIYVDLPTGLKPAAGLSVFAHLEDLAVQGRVHATPQLDLKGRYALANE